jgi:hypothetical protein
MARECTIQEIEEARLQRDIDDLAGRQRARGIAPNFQALAETARWTARHRERRAARRRMLRQITGQL